MKLKIASFALLSSLSFAGIAQAGWYVEGDLGWNNTSDVTWNFTTGSHDVPFDDGWLGAVKVGYDFAGPWRADAEYAYRENDAQYFGPPGSMDVANGEVTSDTYILNAYYDFSAIGKITPYVGAGLGMSKVKANDIRKAMPVGSCCTGIVDDSDTVVAGQIMAGAAYAATQNLDITVEYRYMMADDPSFNYATACTVGSPCAVAGSTSDNYSNHSILVGARFRF